jgi:DNA-binding MarR family transcriptional regulator
MAVNLSRPAGLPPEDQAHSQEEELDRTVELIFLSYRRFWSAAEGPLGARGLGPAHYRALAAIRRKEGMPVSALWRALGVRKQSLARVLADLDAAGFIERIPGIADRRMRLLALTHAGRVAEREASAALRERVRHIFEQVGPEAVKGSVAVIEAMAHFKDKPD